MAPVRVMHIYGGISSGRKHVKHKDNIGDVRQKDLATLGSDEMNPILNFLLTSAHGSWPTIAVGGGRNNDPCTLVMRAK